MTTSTTFSSRAYTDNDLQAVCDLLNICDQADNLDDNYSVADLGREFDDPVLNKSRDLHVWEDRAGKVVAFAQNWIRPTEDEVDGGSYVRIHPDARGLGVEDEVVAWLEDRLRETMHETGKPGKQRGWAPAHYAYGCSIYEERGYKPVRYFFEMIRPLDQPIPEPQFPEGFTLRHMTENDATQLWVDMFNQSFIDHWNHHPMTVESHQHWRENPKYVPGRDLIAVSPDGTFAAFCFCWIDPEDNERNHRNEGWIDILGTRRGFRKIGLGRAMLLSGMLKLKEDGVETAKLGVDAENPTGALRLYESAGFTVRKKGVSFEKAL